MKKKSLKKVTSAVLVAAMSMGLLYIMVLFGCLFDHDELPFLWNHREIRHIPGFEFLIIFFRVGQSDQMAECPGDDIIAAFDRTGNVLVTAENTGDIAGNRWLFSQYE